MNNLLFPLQIFSSNTEKYQQYYNHYMELIYYILFPYPYHPIIGNIDPIKSATLLRWEKHLQQFFDNQFEEKVQKFIFSD